MHRAEPCIEVKVDRYARHMMNAADEVLDLRVLQQQPLCAVEVERGDVVGLGPDEQGNPASVSISKALGFGEECKEVS